MKFASVVVTCEHGGNRIPARWREAFRGGAQALASHRGWDPGALFVARYLARNLAAPLICSQVSRLLVELNRSPEHPRLFSDFSRDLPESERADIVVRFYAPYRAEVQQTIVRLARRGPVLHLSSHSFTPVMDGTARTADVGILYDPRRALERGFARDLQRALQDTSDLRVRRNYPYRGTDDGLTTHLRKIFAPGSYAGIELEMNQGLNPTHYRRLLMAALRHVLS